MIIAGPVLHRAQNDHRPCILLAHLEADEWVALLFRVATLDARVVGSVNLHLFDRLLYICARSLQHSPTPTGFAELIGDGEGDSGDST
jgi:hypothetical protein